MTRSGSCTWNAIVLANAGCYRSERGLWGFSLWRKHCEAGEDTDYYKKPVFLTPVKEGPFYALKVGPALLTVTGGLKTDINFECLDADGKPIFPPEFLKMKEEHDKLNVPQGQGIVDWKAVKAAADAQCDNVIYVVEREASYNDPQDRVACLAEDIAWLKANL